VAGKRDGRKSREKKWQEKSWQEKERTGKVAEIKGFKRI
jgi:hypothetical protein